MRVMMDSPTTKIPLSWVGMSSGKKTLRVFCMIRKFLCTRVPDNTFSGSVASFKLFHGFWIIECMCRWGFEASEQTSSSRQQYTKVALRREEIPAIVGPFVWLHPCLQKWMWSHPQTIGRCIELSKMQANVVHIGEQQKGCEGSKALSIDAPLVVHVSLCPPCIIEQMAWNKKGFAREYWMCSGLESMETHRCYVSWVCIPQ